MQLRGSVALVTGGNRGIGKAFVEGLLAAGANKVYAAARKPDHVTTNGAVPVTLDITNPEQIAHVAAQCADVNLLVNNAGVGAVSPFIGSPGVGEARAAMETNYFGTLNTFPVRGVAHVRQLLGLICRALTVARPVSLDPNSPSTSKPLQRDK